MQEAHLRHANRELRYSLVDLLDQLISHLLHDQHHLDSCAPLPAVAETSLQFVTCLAKALQTVFVDTVDG